jgi:acetoin utilization protein AcuC
MTDPTPRDGPLLVHGPRSGDYDFGPGHPLTPRRFGPGIDLLRAVGAGPGLAPEPATDAELLAIHTERYLAAVRRFAQDPAAAPAYGIAPFGDVPPFAGMHEAAAAVAGGSIRAIEAVVRGEVEHAYHPGGGLHHAMPERASGFCVYNDVALAVSVARRAGLRVLYVDLDVHHGDGVEAIHRDDPGVLTVSFHESGRYLFPGTGSEDEIGDGPAAGTVVNVPFEPMTGEMAWLAAVRAVVPPLAAAFGPDLIVSQHGADGHAWDPLAHLRLTTTAMGAAARLVDTLAHRHAGGRWLATGGGGYEVYRVVPRAWALTWLAGAHREAPDRLPETWRARWAAEADRFDAGPLPERFEDGPNAGLSRGPGQDAAEVAAEWTTRRVRARVLPRLLLVAEERGWWEPSAPAIPTDLARASEPDRRSTPTVVDELDRETLEGLGLAPRTIAPADPAVGRAILARAADEGGRVIGAVADGMVVGVALVIPGPPGSVGRAADELVAVGVAPAWRGRGLGRSLVRAAADAARARGVGLSTLVGPGDRDPAEPLSLDIRQAVAERLLAGAGLVRGDAGGCGEAVEAVRPYSTRGA